MEQKNENKITEYFMNSIRPFNETTYIATIELALTAKQVSQLILQKIDSIPTPLNIDLVPAKQPIEEGTPTNFEEIPTRDDVDD